MLANFVVRRRSCLCRFFSSPNQVEVASNTVYLWIFWAAAVPLTVLVLAIYALYLLHIGRRNGAEDRYAKPSPRANNSSNPIPTFHGPKSTPSMFRIPFTNAGLQISFNKVVPRPRDEERPGTARDSCQQTDATPGPLRRLGRLDDDISLHS